MKKVIKNIGLWLIVIIAGVIVILTFPTNQYLRKALIYTTPDIDDYKIFDNRTIKANNPQPWKISPLYNQKEIPSEYIPVFEKFETIAYLIVKDTSIVFEKYWDGYNQESLSNSFSAAKSIIALLAGIARDEGKIVSFDQPAADYYQPYASDDRQQIMIRDLLTMSSGLDWNEAYSSPFSITTKAYYGDDIEKLIAGLHLVEAPGKRFRYQSGVTQLLSFVIANATGELISDYASRTLWTPIGAEHDALWSLDHEEGLEKAYCCFNSNVRDFARIGQLILNEGSWNGVQVVSRDFIREATAPATWLKDGDTDKNVDFYGYQWWRLTRRNMEVIYARGILGQYILAIPDMNMVVVRLGHKRSENKTAGNYPDDIDTWLDAAFSLVE